MNQMKLAEAAGLGLSTIVDYERERRAMPPSTQAAICSALESAGVIFVEENGEGPGVRLRKSHGRANDHAKPVGPATALIEKMDEAIATDAKKRRKK